MSRRRKGPPRSPTDDERQESTHLSRSRTAPAISVARAVVLSAVADGADYRQAARAAGRKSGDAVSHLVARFNREGAAALDPRRPGRARNPARPGSPKPARPGSRTSTCGAAPPRC